ncbi:MAG: hypothetical protein ACKV2V_16070, partial [Blastocatellia bacterium]
MGTSNDEDDRWVTVRPTLTCDVFDFRKALAGNDLPAAIRIYEERLQPADLLGGYAGKPGWEWIRGSRDELKDLYAKALSLVASRQTESEEQIRQAGTVQTAQPTAGHPDELTTEYLDRLKALELKDIDRYTPVSGSSQRPVRMEVVCSLEPADRETPSKTFVDAVDEIPIVKRAVLLGEPGGGKTTILWKLVDNLAEAVRRNPKSPLPLLIPLGFWTEA